ncbi:hypothetical protein NJC38_07485 [Pseudomonas sp. 21LCFQ010]|uniref:DUF7415 domain-containing protein n=1 Tax=Pseudomonas sp. 21LCFQ010 TaxID=2957506 RepID=UPI002096AF28|nr:hypothetical protein [Pseudomonas sp. 21LCFQ010]MCO8161999.1 hypothetical protein [Pseudomonas sp. 21LCFQ010]
MKLIDWNELSRLGLMVRINREILHPLGLAVSRDPETGKSSGAVVSDDGPFCYPDDLQVPEADVLIIKRPLEPDIEWFQAEMATLREAVARDGGCRTTLAPLTNEAED